jgi:HEAT repeat protein
MSDPTASKNPELARDFAAFVALLAERPSDAMEHRAAVAGVVTRAAFGPTCLTTGADGGLLADGAPLAAPLLAARFAAYGIEELTITPKVVAADLMDLARLLAAEPVGEDPAARFAGRAAAIDRRTLPRRLRPRAAAPVEEPKPATPPRATPKSTPKSTPRSTPKSTPRATPTTPQPAVSLSPDAPPTLEPEVPRDAPERLVQALAIPDPHDPQLAAAVRALRDAPDIAALRTALEQVALVTDLAFRTGRHDDLIQGLAALVAVEHEALERDSADERRQAFNHAVRRLARPVLLRQVAVLRHERAADPVVSEQLQQVLYRFGTDGAEALVDEYVSAATPEARATCLNALRGLRRTHDALLALARDTRDLVVRQAAAILGELRDARGEAILLELLRHPDARARRAAVAALGNFESASALEAIGLSLGDESPIVRLRAVASLTGRREPRVLELLRPLIDQEPDREVLYTAIGAVGKVGTPEAVQLLIRVAQGEGAHPLRRSAGMRLQACTALVAIRTPTTMAAVQGLREDRDREVREAAVRLVAQAQRRTTTTGIPAVQGP